MIAIANLSNNLLTHAASKSLASIKRRHPEVFKSNSLYYRAIHFLGRCHYRSTVRSYILELFTVPLSPAIAKEILEAGERMRSARRQALSSQSIPHANGIQDNTKSFALDPMYKLNLESDSEQSSVSDDEDRLLAPKEALEPKMVLRGFIAL